MPFFYGRKFFRQIGTAQTDGIEMKINDRARTEIIPLIPAANTANESFHGIRHIAS